MNPNEISLENLSKIFEYERISREIDSCEDIDQVKEIAKCFAKLNFKQEEVVASLGLMNKI